MSKTVVQEKNRLHANDQSEELSDFVTQDIRELADLLESRIARLRKQALLVIEQDQGVGGYEILKQAHSRFPPRCPTVRRSAASNSADRVVEVGRV
jgi:hypothetical protein